MNIAIIGYGKMGKEIEKVLIERNHNIVLTINENNLDEFNEQNLKEADIAIEFTTPENAVSNFKLCFNAGLPVVSGTTGWLDKFDEISELCKKNEYSFFYASNFSLGVNILFEINNQLSVLMNKFSGYNLEIDEIHHLQKKDSPSGTAIKLANDIINNIERKSEWVNNIDAKEEQIKINSYREDKITGIHTIKYESDVDIIKLKHSAKSRKGFAVGAVLAAEFLIGKKGVYSMKDLLNL
ncbi:MAG: 4-hydroxy-tetrahydrodipicolinate reductase [Bacteroidales bacterium]|nr:4-hydroxy-tetrahydrodipicolinate reductase [Bacteroidales bacterium]